MELDAQRARDVPINVPGATGPGRNVVRDIKAMQKNAYANQIKMKDLDDAIGKAQLNKSFLSDTSMTTKGIAKDTAQKVSTAFDKAKGTSEFKQFLHRQGAKEKFKFFGKRAAYMALKMAPGAAVAGGISGAISSTLNKSVYDSQSTKSKKVLDELDTMKKRLESSRLTQGTPYSAIPAQTPSTPSRSSSPPRKKKATNKHVSFDTSNRYSASPW